MRCQGNGIPSIFIAEIESEPVGTVSIVEHDMDLIMDIIILIILTIHIMILTGTTVMVPIPLQIFEEEISEEEQQHSKILF